MKWAWRIGRLAGIDIKIHATFALILAWVGFAYWVSEREWQAVLGGIGFVLAIFACVVLHELGHALVAQRFGIRTRDITLLPIGGVARLERMPEDPKQEIWVALAGPAVNGLIILGLLVGLVLFSVATPFDLSLTEGTVVKRLIAVNAVLVLFNMLPAFPMDGGRVLRGLLALRMSFARATRVAATVGQGMAVLFGVAGLFFFGNPFLVLIAVFVWLGAAREATVAEMKTALEGVRVERAMLTQYATVSPHDSLARLVDLILAGSQEDFPVVEDGRVVGVVSRDDLVAGLAKCGRSAEVSQIMRREVESVEATEMLESVFPRLEGRQRIIPVTRFGELVGLITLDNVGEFISIQSALGRRAA